MGVWGEMPSKTLAEQRSVFLGVGAGLSSCLVLLREFLGEPSRRLQESETILEERVKQG